MLTYTIKQGSLWPPIKVLLGTSKSGGFVNYGFIKFRMMNSQQLVVIDTDATVNDASSGDVQYDWVAGDTDTPGAYWAEFYVEYSDGTPDVFPNRGFINIMITPGVADG